MYKVLKKFKYFFKLFFFYLIELLLNINQFRKIYEANGKIIIIRTDGMGDFILWLESAIALNYFYRDKGYSTVLIATKVNIEIAKMANIFDEYFEVDRIKFMNSLIYRYHILKAIKKDVYEYAINPVHYSYNLLEGSIMRNITSKNKIGSLSENSNETYYFKKFAKFFNVQYNKIMKVSSNNEIDYNYLFVKEIIKSNSYFQNIKIENLFNINEVNYNDEKYCVIIPGAGWDKRKWPLKNFIDLLYRINETANIKCFVVGGQNEEKLGFEINKSIKTTINLIGKTTIGELIKLFKNAHFILGNDTGLIHLSALFNPKTFAIIGGGNYGKFFPYPKSDFYKYSPIVINKFMDCYNCDWQCPYLGKRDGTVKCIKEITVEMVLHKLKENVFGLDWEKPSFFSTHSLRNN